MLIWFALVIPFAAIIILAAKFNHKMAWWEYLAVFLLSFGCIAISKYTAETSLTNDTEYWNSYGVNAYYYEHWNEYIHKTCEDCTTYYTGTGKNRTSHRKCKTRDCSYVQDHPAYWQLNDNINQSFGISQSYWNNLTIDWKNRSFQAMHHNCHTICGDAYYTNYNNDSNKIVPIVTKHTYENRVQAATSVFNFQEVDTATISKYSLFKYPEDFDKFNFSYIMGDDNMKANKIMRYNNAMYGKSKKLHMLILVFRDKPQQAAFMQEAYWKGGNKNEFILCIGLNTSSNNIEWAKVISWSDDKSLKVDVESDMVELRAYNIVKIANYLGDTVCKRFKKKSFKDFSYLTVQPSNFAVAMTYIITLLVTVGMAVFAVKNDIDRDG